MEKRKLAKIPREEATGEMVRFAERAAGTHIVTTKDIEKDLLMVTFYPIRKLKKGKKGTQFRTFFSKNDYISQDLTVGKSGICGTDCQKRNSRRRKQKDCSVRICN